MIRSLPVRMERLAQTGWQLSFSALLDSGLIVIKNGVRTTIEEPRYRAHRICVLLHSNRRRWAYSAFSCLHGIASGELTNRHSGLVSFPTFGL